MFGPGATRLAQTRTASSERNTMPLYYAAAQERLCADTSSEDCYGCKIGMAQHTSPVRPLSLRSCLWCKSPRRDTVSIRHFLHSYFALVFPPYSRLLPSGPSNLFRGVSPVGVSALQREQALQPNQVVNAALRRETQPVGILLPCFLPIVCTRAHLWILCPFNPPAHPRFLLRRGRSQGCTSRTSFLYPGGVGRYGAFSALPSDTWRSWPSPDAAFYFCTGIRLGS